MHVAKRTQESLYACFFLFHFSAIIVCRKKAGTLQMLCSHCINDVEGSFYFYDYAPYPKWVLLPFGLLSTSGYQCDSVPGSTQWFGISFLEGDRISMSLSFQWRKIVCQGLRFCSDCCDKILWQSNLSDKRVILAYRSMVQSIQARKQMDTLRLQRN